MGALKGAAIDRFMAEPDLSLTLYLIYGPDDGLVRERARALIARTGVSPDDPFALSRLSESDLADDPARLADEAGQMALMVLAGPARRVVWIEEAGPAAARALKSLLEDPPGDALIIAEAGNLRPNAPLRQVAEKSARAVAIPSYADEAQALSRLVDGEVHSAGLSISGEARALLVSLLGADRQLSRREIEKLCAYALDKGRITTEDVESICGDVTADTIDRAIDASLEGDRAGLERAFSRALGEGVSPIRLMNALERQLWMLLRADLGRAEGKSVDAALAGIRPPLHFRRKDRLKAQSRHWPRQRLARALAQAEETDAALRQTGLPQAAIAQRFFLSLAAARKG